MLPDGYLIDTLNPDDLPQVMMVERLSFAHPWNEEAFAAEFAKSYAFFLGVRQEHEVVAVLLYWVVFPEIHILSLGVHPDHRRQGLASWLLQVLMEMGPDMECEKIDLEVRENNLAGQKLYESMGFARVGRRKNYYTDTMEDAFLYSYYFRGKTA
ncbi:MAG: ribosomal-protein-alanine N-acetyltransferase [Deltaproteobacteria bacterium HGW-Deltaproteobacteria-22]|jgi:ribosomal-protein-alanine N-acetyltransferase|nr:MAG: ribosomal-protein-alanine N-acetyltransferase [Deltaproteobacteria bacterium HGW-Deltaproteobacteria-22]